MLAFQTVGTWFWILPSKENFFVLFISFPLLPTLICIAALSFNWCQSLSELEVNTSTVKNKHDEETQTIM